MASTDVPAVPHLVQVDQQQQPHEVPNLAPVHQDASGTYYTQFTLSDDRERDALEAAAAVAVLNSSGVEPEQGSGTPNQSPQTRPPGPKRCAVIDCDENTNGNRSLCARHQKRKERGEDLLLKENHILGHRKKQYSTLKARQKHRRFKDLHESLLRIAGEKEQVPSLIQEYLQSSFYSEFTAVPREPGDKKHLFEMIGENAIELYKSLPPRSPFRRSLLLHLGNGIKQSEFAEICDINPRTIRYARSSKDDIFKNTKYKYPGFEEVLAEGDMVTDSQSSEPGEVGAGTAAADSEALAQMVAMSQYPVPLSNEVPVQSGHV